MNLVEVWFGIIERQAIRRGTFGSVRDLTTKIRGFHRRLERPLPPIGLDQDRRPDPHKGKPSEDFKYGHLTDDPEHLQCYRRARRRSGLRLDPSRPPVWSSGR